MEASKATDTAAAQRGEKRQAEQAALVQNANALFENVNSYIRGELTGNYIYFFGASAQREAGAREPILALPSSTSPPLTSALDAGPLFALFPGSRSHCSILQSRAKILNYWSK